jgi:hypothetical protein
MKRYVGLLAVVALVLASGANAAVQQGDTELNFLGGWMSQDGESEGADFSAWFLSGGVGYFLNDNLQVSGAALLANSETEVNSGLIATGLDVDVDIYGLGGQAKWHFMPTNQWVPFVGLQLFWVDIDVDVDDPTLTFDGGEDADGTMWGPILGIRYELNAYNDFFVEYQYHMWEGDVGDLLDDGHGIFLGIIHQFK